MPTPRSILLLGLSATAVRTARQNEPHTLQTPTPLAAHEIGVCAIFTFRYESAALMPWIAYNSLLGVDRFFLWEDDFSPRWRPSRAETRLSSLLQALPDRVSLVGMRSVEKGLLANGNITNSTEQERTMDSLLDARHHPPTWVQNLMVQSCARRSSEGAATWMGGWDVDEYPVLSGVHAASASEEGGVPPLKRFLRNMTSAGANVVVLPRTPMGASPVMEWPADDGTFETEDYLQRTQYPEPSPKLLWRTAAANTCDVHCGILKEQTSEDKARASILWPDGSRAPARLEHQDWPRSDDLWRNTRNAAAGEGIADDDPDPMTFDGPNGWMRYTHVTGQPLRLNHYRYRSVAECQFKEACNNVETDHAPGAGGWRVNAHQSVAEGGNDVCTLDGESPRDATTATLSPGVRREMVRLFGADALALHRELQGEFTRRLRALPRDENGTMTLPAIDGENFFI